MNSKPVTCKGCPLYGDGKGFVPGIYPTHATVVVIGQNPGADEERAGEPFVGKTGQEMARTYLPLAGLDLAEIGKDNAIRCRWTEPGKHTKSNKLPTGKILQQALGACRVHDHPLDQYRLVILQGGVALQKFYPDLKQHEWRGHLLPERST